MFKTSILDGLKLGYKEDGIGIGLGLGRISERFLVSFPNTLASESEMIY